MGVFPCRPSVGFGLAEATSLVFKINTLLCLVKKIRVLSSSVYMELSSHIQEESAQESGEV